MSESTYFKHYQLSQQVDTWQDAIHLAAGPLLENKCITDNYVQSMINNVIENGPYIVIMPQVALPHTRSEEGALKTSISVVKLVEPVMFPEQKEVKLIIAFAAYDSETHMKLLSSLVDVLMDDEVMEHTLACDNLPSLQEWFKL